MKTKYIQKLTDQDVEKIIDTCVVTFDGQTIKTIKRKEHSIVVTMSDETTYFVYDYAFEGFPRTENAVEKYVMWMTEKFGTRYTTEFAERLYKVPVFSKEVEEANARLTAALNNSDAFVDKIIKKMKENKEEK